MKTAQYLQKMIDLEELLARGCDWLKYYLETHPDEAKQLKVCQTE